MLALSIVSPHGSNIASGKKTLEVRSWRPESLPIRDLLIVENSHFLSADNPIDPDGRAVAIVDVEAIHEWQPSEVKAACSNGWVILPSNSGHSFKRSFGLQTPLG